MDTTPRYTSSCNTIDLHTLGLEVNRTLSSSRRPKADENLLELGLDSVAVLKITSWLRRQGYLVRFPLLMENPTLNHWMSLLETSQASFPEEPHIADNSLPLSTTNIPFPLTDVQHAYWIGRRDDQPLGGIGCHAYLELDGENIDGERLQAAWCQLHRQHAMLNCRFLENGTQCYSFDLSRQKIQYNDLHELDDNAITSCMATLRETLSHRRLHVEKGEVACLTLTRFSHHQYRMHLNLDLLIADVASLQILLRDLARAYTGDPLAEGVSAWRFANYLSQQLSPQKAEHDKAYWLAQLDTLPPPLNLPLAVNEEQITAPRFLRRQYLFTAEDYARLKQLAAHHQTTPAMTLLSAWSLIIAAWSAQDRFFINLPLFNRTGGHDTDNVIADFTSLLLLPIHCDNPDDFLNHLRRTERRFYQDVEHASFSGVQLQRELAKHHNSKARFAPLVFACNLGQPLVDSHCNRHLGKLTYMVSQTPQVWLDHQLYEHQEGLLLCWDSVEALFPHGMIDSMFQRYIELVRWLLHNDWQQPLPAMLPPAQRETRDTVNNTAALIPPQLLHHAFFCQAQRTPDALAVIDASHDSVLSYQALSREALKLAAMLCAQGMAPAEPIAVMLPRGPQQIIAVLGILAAGCSYVPVGLNHPPQRQQRILTRGGIRLAIVVTPPDDTLWRQSEIQFLPIDKAQCYAPLTAPAANDAAQTAYIIFTSGSTGEPKGVMISHRAAWNTIADINQRFQLNTSDRALALSALDFDLSVYDIFGLLSTGGAIVTMDEDHRRDAALWLKWLVQWRISLWNSVPALLEMLLIAAENNSPPIALRQVLLSGDWVSLSLPQRLAKQWPQISLSVLGGATEAAIWSNIQEVSLPLPSHWKRIPYGRPLANQRFRVVNPWGQDCPDWVSGELWIGGVGVAQGYCGDVERSADAFVNRCGERWYRTGDNGRYWPDGTLEFLGRQDQQIKIRGYRIELGEIETALLTLSGTSRALALVQEQPLAIIAALECAHPPEEVSDQLTLLSQRLPEYMLPRQILHFTVFPLTANGKIDKQAILAQATTQQAQPQQQPPVGMTENVVAQVWRTLLGVEDLHRASDFFQCGGDSLVATRMVQMLAQHGVTSQEPLRHLFSHPQLAAFANGLQHTITPSAPETALLRSPLADNEPFPLTEVQNAYWLGSASGMPLHCETEYVLMFNSTTWLLPDLKSAWQKLLDRHPMLRAFVTDDGQQQVAAKAVAAIPLIRLTDGNEQLARERLRHGQAPLIEKLPVNWLAITWKNAGQKMLLTMRINYLFLDAYSVKILLRELSHYLQDDAPSLPPLQLRWQDYLAATACATQEKKNAQQRWLSRLETLPSSPQLPLVRSPLTAGAARVIRRETQLDTALWADLRLRAKDEGLTPSALLLTVYASVLAANSQCNDITLNLTLFDRQAIHTDVTRLVGDFTRLTPVVFRYRERTSFSQQARQAQQEIAIALDNRAVSSLWVQRQLTKRPSPTTGFPVVFTSTLGLEDDFADALPTDALELTSGGWSMTPQTWIDHQVWQQQGVLMLCWDCVDDLFSDGFCATLFNDYCQLLHHIATADWKQPLSYTARYQPTVQISNAPLLLSVDQTPGDNLEQQIARLWQQTLQQENLPHDTNFFLCGGDSLKATHIVTKLHEQRLTPQILSLRLFFTHPTIAGLAAHIRSSQAQRKDDEGIL